MTATRINPTSKVVEHIKPFAPEPEGGWTYKRDKVARSLYRYIDDDLDRAPDRSTTVNIPDQVYEDQKAYDGLAFPTIEGEYVWLDGEAYGLHTSGTSDCIVRDAVAPE